ncbi:MAG: sugar transferase, partial [Mesorhizobium sp.]
MNAFDMPIGRLAMHCVSHGRGRRALDVIAASLGLIILSPLMLLIAVALL